MLSIDVIGSGSISPIVGVHSYAEGTEVVISASSSSGWLFDHWLLDSENDGNINPYTITMNDDYSLTAVFIEDHSWLFYVAIIVIIILAIVIVTYFILIRL